MTSEPAIVERPLNATQLKTLERIINDDLNEASAELLRQIDEQHAARVEAIHAEYNNQSVLSTANTAQTALIRQFEDDITNAWQRLAEAHPKVQFTKPTLSMRGVHDLQLRGYNEAITEANEARRILRAEVGATVERERRALTRQVLLQGVTNLAAAELVNDTPNAEDLLNTVQARLGDSAKRALQVLNPKAPTKAVKR